MAAASLDGSFNFRDTGGMPLRDGGSTRAGVLYRSDALSGLTPTGLEQLATTSIGVIVDFRSPIERMMAPDRLPATRPFRVVELALLEGALTGLAQQAMQAGAQAGDPDAAASAVQHALAQLPRIGELYVSMLTHGGAAFAELARLVAAPDDVPQDAAAVLVHCTAGKDRTGVGIALLLDAVGADRDAVIADYTSSEANLSGAWAERMFAMISAMGVPRSPELDALVAGTPASAIAEAFEWIDGEHADSAAYLRSNGVTVAELDALRRRLTA
ncbi:MAG TPA: tyrosine-protein phosphatase [Microbacterium sp.]|nr:tyrosine-protein phosphatase [Microbacterium sp.]